MVEGKQRIECEFVIPSDGICTLFRISHQWEREDERVQICAFCGAEWWNAEQDAAA
jgi:hypothetical protein